jgi:hypothetical protein
MVLPAEKKL